MNFQDLLNKTITKLKMLGYEREANLIKYSNDKHELISCLREYVFRKDDKVKEFVDSL